MSLPALQSIAENLCTQLDLKQPTYISSGAFKETYKAIKADGRNAALKIINPAKCNIERSERELKAIQRCDSPYICKLYGDGKYTDSRGADYYYFIEEFLGGGTLTQRMHPGLAVEKIVNYGVCLAKSLAHLYLLKLVHRDIKPDNIMFTEGSDDPVLVDFGLVRDLSATSITPTWVMQGPGTPLFAAPEQLHNEKPMISWKTDQFSLGVVLGMCLTGNHPYYRQGNTLPDVVNLVAARSTPSSEFVDGANRAGLSNIVKMVAAWPIQRFSRPEDLLHSFPA